MRTAQSGKTRKEKIVFLGAASTGKTSIVTRIAHDTFTGQSTATVGAAFVNKAITVDGTTLSLEIWDTGGSEKYKALAPMYYRDARLAIIVFDMTVKRTVEEAASWIDELRQKGQADCIIIGAANKSDLVDQRTVTPDEVEDFKFQHQIEAIFETSAKTGDGIQSLIQEASKLLLKLQPLQTDEEYIDVGPSTPSSGTRGNNCNC